MVPGLLALTLVWRAWVDRPRAVGAPQPTVDYAGAALLTISVVVLLLGVFEFGTPLGWVLLLAALLLFALLAWIERRAADLVLPLPLFRGRLVAIACLHGVLAGTAPAPGGWIAQLAARRAQGDADNTAPPAVATEM